MDCSNRVSFRGRTAKEKSNLSGTARPRCNSAIRRYARCRTKTFRRPQAWLSLLLMSALPVHDREDQPRNCSSHGVTSTWRNLLCRRVSFASIHPNRRNRAHRLTVVSCCRQESENPRKHGRPDSFVRFLPAPPTRANLLLSIPRPLYGLPTHRKMSLSGNRYMLRLSYPCKRQEQHP